MVDMITIKTEDGEIPAHVERPNGSPAPAVVVLHEIFGVNDDVRATCRELAAAGFISIALELFWRAERGVDLNSWSEEEWEKGFALYSAYDRDAGVRDIAAAIRAARTMDGSTGKVAVMGFCLGGLMTFLTAARQEVDAAVAYHGAETEKYLEEVDGLTAPLLMHLAEEDEFIGKNAQARITRALADVPGATIHSYPGQRHAFARHRGAHYDAEAAALANTRTVQFLNKHLQT